MERPLDDPPPSRPRISLTANLSKPRPKIPTSNGVKRRAAFGGDDDEVEIQDRPKQLDISSFGASDTSGAPQAPVIAPIPNKDWRAETQRKRQKSALPGKEQQIDEETSEDKIKSGQVKAGLQLLERRQENPDTAVDAPPEINREANGVRLPRTDEERAIAELKGETLQDEDQMITPIASTNNLQDAPPSPDGEASLARYDATPVDGFGSALLRGYMKPGQTLQTWRETQEAKMLRSRKGKQAQGVESKREGRRPDLLGIGAKEIDTGDKQRESKGGKIDFRKQKREQAEYAPVARKNRSTGEMITEAQLQERVKGSKEAELVFEEQKGQEGERTRQKLLLNGDRRSDRDEDGRKMERRRNGDESERRERDRRRDDRRETDRYEDSKRGKNRDRPQRDKHDGSSEDDRDKRYRSRRDRYGDYSDDDRVRRRKYQDRDKDDSRHERRRRERSEDGHRHRK